MDIPTLKVEWNSREYRNVICEELDKYVVEEHLPSVSYGGGTYFDGYIADGHMGIRFPGATRGSIVFDKDGIITDIWLYDDAPARAVQCYKPEAYQAVKKFIGSKLIFL
jgi:hypothetical protein